MKRTLIASVLGLLAISFAMPAMAADKNKGGKAGDAGKPAKDKKFDFEADEVTGELVKPEGVDINAVKFTAHDSLIRVRQDFIKEIVKSAEDL
jgi:hypothetical protein